MFGIRFIKFYPTTYVLKYKKGKIVKKGAGLAFYYYAPTTSLVAVPSGSREAPFIFEEVSSDFQHLTIQGELTYRISDPVKIASLLNFTLGNSGTNYLSDDPEKLPQRVINIVRVSMKKEIMALPLREALKASELLTKQTLEEMKNNKEITSLGIELLGLSILAINPTPETQRALEAETREKILQEADDAIYTRRNSSVEQERKIKENELNTEIAVENKKKQIKEKQLEAEMLVQQKKQEIKDENMDFNIQLEKKRKNLVENAVENARLEADTKAYGLNVIMKVLNQMNPTTLNALTTLGMEPNKLIALAFEDIAKKAEKIGQLNISPDLLKELLDKDVK
ncbi:MAG: SPFH domain-containing protein [Spirochaetales bacterium]|nr:SPFH domain-containing protein [Spirochaetales bacterium]